MNCNIKEILLYVWEILTKISNTTNYQLINSIIVYLTLCIATQIILFFLKIVVYFVVELLEIIKAKIEKNILGKNNEKSIEYTFMTLWFIKFDADISYFFDWLKYDIFKTYTVIGVSYNREFSILEKVRVLSLDNLFHKTKGLCNSLFYVSFLHIILILVSFWSAFKSDILLCVDYVNFLINKNIIHIEDIIRGFELLTFLWILFFIILDIRHKIGGYIELRQERFKKLIVLEEKLLLILQEMQCSLYNNINVIAQNKIQILNSGASELCGMPCYIKKSGLCLYDKNERLWNITQKRTDLFCSLDNMNEVFEKMSVLKKEFEESSLNYSNIYYVDYNTIFRGIRYIWLLWNDNKNFQRMEFFCRNCMEEWYNNWFMSPVKNMQGEVNYYSQSATMEEIRRASAVLDFELKRAFVMELSLRKYARKIEKRMKKLHRFSRIGLS